MRLAVASLLVLASVAQAADTYSWRYYRPTNTGIQGDSCEALKIGPDGNPWIGGYDPGFEEGGFSKFLVAQNRWLNYSNVDYPVIGHPENTGTARVSDFDTDAQGRLWMATARGGLFFDPAVGPTSLRRFGEDNSLIRGGWNKGVEVAPDGTVWFSAYSTVWGNGGVSRYNPTTNAWQSFDNYGGEHLAVQPIPGGYYVWANFGPDIARYSSITGTWTTLPKQVGSPAFLPGKNLTDSAGNTWMYRWTNVTESTMRLDLLRPNGTWVNTTPAPFDVAFNSAHATRALGDQHAVFVDGGGTAFRYDTGTWTNLGMWRNHPWTDDVDMDASGTVWVCSTEGAARRDPATGLWQRYRITNTSQYDFFNNNLSIGQNGEVYATANAGPGYGGMVAFDGQRWKGFNNHHYGLGVDWPFDTDNSARVYVRPSNNHVLVNPTFHFLHDYSGGSWTDMQAPFDSPGDMIEDSLGRLWMCYPGALYRRDGLFWTRIGVHGGYKLVKAPRLPGTVWCVDQDSIQRTNGTTIRLWAREDFPEMDPNSDVFSGLVIGRDGMVWFGAATVNLPQNSGLYRLNPTTGAYTVERNADGWRFPGEYVSPLVATPDGKIWMQYDSDYLTAVRGMCWFDGRSVGQFPAPPFGEMQWGGLPHAGIYDAEVRIIRDGYEVWLSCASRGLAVLTVKPPKIGRK